MKKQTLLPGLFLLFFFTLGFNKAKAHPGDSCSSAIIITPIYTPTITDYEFGSGDSVKWFTFIAPYSRLTIETDFPILTTDTPRAYIDSLIIYKGSTCGSLTREAYTTCRYGGDSLPSIQMLTFVSSARYYVKVTRYRKITGCALCPAYFGLVPIRLPSPIIPPPPSCTQCGPNLLCNGNFENTNLPVGYLHTLPCNSYQDDSWIWPATPAPSHSYCIQSPNMRFSTSVICNLAPLTYTPDVTDLYLIGVNFGNFLYATARSGNYLMLVDPPSQRCLSCSPNSGPIPISNWTSTSWVETVPNIPGGTYLFSCWLRYADSGNVLPGATVNINFNSNPPFFSDVINIGNYSNWQNVTGCWSDTSSFETMQISDTGSFSASGYDYEIDSVTYQLASLPVITYTPSYTICPGSGVQLVTSYSHFGSPLLTYSWAPSAGLSNTAIAEPIASPTVTTVYTCTIGSTQGTCTQAAVVTVSVYNLNVTFSPPNPMVCGSASVTSVTATAGGGTPAYTYSWSNGQTTANATGLVIGSYTLSVTDANGCTVTSSISVIQDNLSVTLSNYSGCGFTGSLTANATLGSSPYTYLWSPTSKTTATVTGLSAGTYTVTVTDANGCTRTASATVSLDSIKVAISMGSGGPYTPCVGNPVTLTAFVSPGVSPYTYLWTPSAATTVSITYTATASPVTYTVKVTDANGCTATSSITITPDNIGVTLSGDTVVCSIPSGGYGTTTITANPTGGLSPYTYSWSPSGGTSSSANLSMGTYTVTVTDKNGCTATASVKINPDNLGLTVTDAKVCTNTGTATLTATATGYHFPFTYSWAPGGQTTAVVTGLSIGTYTVTATDAIGCSVAVIGIVSLDNLSISLSGPPDACIPVPNATITSSVSGGVSPYTYAWSTSTSNLPVTGPSTNSTVDVLLHDNQIGGYVYLTVTDNIGCSKVDTFLLRGCCGLPLVAGWYLSVCDFTSGTPCFPFSPTPLTIANGSTVTWNPFTSTWIISSFTPADPLSISGPIDINVNTTIECCDVRMASMAKIIVHSPYTLTIDNSHFHSCPDYNYMWDKIDVQPGASIQITASLMEEAQNVAYIENGSSLADVSNYYMYQTIFNKDSIGVEVMPYPYPHPGYIAACTFSSDTSASAPCTSSPPPPYFSISRATPIPQIVPNVPNRGAFGMVIRGVQSLTIGDPSVAADSNVFIDIDCGIYTEASSPTILNARFWNMTPVTGSIMNNSHVPLAGIYAKGGLPSSSYSLVAGSRASFYNYPSCIYNHCQYGIWARDTIYADIEGNYIYGYPASYSGIIPNPCYGVFLEDNFGTELHVAHNDSIHNCKYGIGAYNNAASMVMFDSNASITTGPWWNTTNPHGIDIFEVATSPSYSVIANNLNSVYNGIYGANLVNPRIVLDTITLNTIRPQVFGIDMDNGSASFIKLNRIIGNSYAGPKGIGIWINMGSATGDQIKCNTMYYPDTGLYIIGNRSPIIIEQDSFYMPLTCTPYGTGMYLSPINGFIGVNPVTAPETNYWNIGSCLLSCAGAPEATFSGLGGNGFWVPSSACINKPPAFPVFNDGFPPVTFTVTSNPDNYNCFTQLFALAPPPRPHDAFMVLNNSVAYPIYQQTANWEARYNLYNYMCTVDSSLADSSKTIQYFFDSAQHANLGRIVEIGRLLSDPKGVNQNDLSSAQALYNAITNADTAESIYKSVFNVMIAMYNAGGQFIPQIPAQIACLKAIAPLCPAQYGNGVFLARALLSQIDNTRHWPDMCNGSGGAAGTGEGNGDHKAQKRSGQTVDSINSIIAKVYPNPANTLLNIEMNLPAGQVAYFTMYNDIGEKIENMQLTSEMTNLSITSLPSGMYYYRITDKNGNLVIADKQMILH